MAALDLLSRPEPVNNRPKKRPCLRWDDAGPPLFDDARLQLQLAFQACSVFPGGEDEGERDPCSIMDCLVTDSQQLKSHRLPSTHGHEDDEDGHFNYRQGDDLSPRYTIFRPLGEGTFGKVWECWDRLYKELVAIKVVRSAEKYRKAAMTEVNLLYTLAEKDVDGLGGCVRIRDYFYHQNRVCIVCEKLGPSLFDFLRTNNYRPFSIDLVREFGRQILGSVAFMHSVRVIHTDLKPENVLLVSSGYSNVYYKNGSKPPVQMERVPVSSRVKLIDFGSATFDRADCFSIVSTRHYRAPEVILGLGWSFPCDIWSVGCILIELCSGEALFQTHENTEHLAMMERVLGPIPSHIVKKSMSIAGKYFRDGGELNWPDESTSKYRVWVVRNLPRLRNLVMKHADHSAGLFINLLEQLLKFDPEERPTASEALKHPFFGKVQREYDQ